MISFSDLNNKFFEFGRVSSKPICCTLRFSSDGSISGYDHDNERYWSLDEGILSLFDSRKNLTAVFQELRVEDCRLLLFGYHVPDPSIKFQLREIGFQRLQRNPTKDAFINQIEKFGWEIGDYTYGIPGVAEQGYSSRLIIGKFCSIASHVNIALANHRTDVLTTFPFATLSDYWFTPRGIQDHTLKGDVVIGNDVWIGTNVFIGAGVSVGDGAIIGAHSVVTKNVEPYSVVVGNPAKFIRFRFDANIIDTLLNIKWWNLDQNQIETIIPLLLKNDALSLIDRVKQLRFHSD